MSKTKKGFVFIIDIAVAMGIVFLILMVSLFYVTRTDTGSIANAQLVKTGYDVITVLDYMNSLQSFDKDTIQADLFQILPVSYHMRLQVKGNTDLVIIETAQAMPNDRFIASGKRFFITDTGEPGVAMFWIWVR